MTSEIDVILLGGFRKAAKKLFSEDGLAALIEFLGAHPEKGDLIPGAGGLRKLRWALAGGGKRGGARVIYYLHRSECRVLLLTAYAKSKKEDLTEREKRLLSTLIDEILEQD